MSIVRLLSYDSLLQVFKLLNDFFRWVDSWVPVHENAIYIENIVNLNFSLNLLKELVFKLLDYFVLVNYQKSSQEVAQSMVVHVNL